MTVKKVKSIDELVAESTKMLTDPETAEKGFQRLKVLEEKGSVQAACVLALALTRGDGTKEDPNLAFAIINKYAKSDNPDVNYIIGTFYENGIGTKKDVDHAIFCYRIATNYDFVPAYIALARCYREGIGVEKSLQHAFAMTMMAANLGHADSMYNVALHYLNGWSVEKDRDEGRKWILKASDAGSVAASVLWGNFCINAEDYENAVKYFTRAAEKDNSHALYVLHQCYRDGLGIKQDRKKAFALCSKAAELGDIDALSDMGIWFEYGYNTIKQNYAEALKWYLKAGEAGNPTGWLNAGYAYINGRGTKQNDDKAYECFKKAADMGDAGGICSVGWCYRDGTGVKKDLSTAFKYLCTAAFFGDGEAMDSVGYAYENGEGVDKDEKMGFRFYMKAAEKGIPNALCNVAECYLLGMGVEKNIEEAQFWYVRAEKTDCKGFDRLKKLFDKELKKDVKNKKR